MFAYAHSQKVFADVQSEHPVFQMVAFVPDLVPGHHWIELRSTFFAPSLQMFTYIYKFLPVASLLQDNQFQISQPFFMWQILQSLHHLLLPDVSQFVHVSHTQEPRTAHFTLGVVSPVLTGG